MRRMGELLKTFNAQGRRADALSDGTVRKLTQKREAAHAAGISERQEATAVRVANVPADKFEAAIESEKPETVTALAEMGKRVGSAGRECLGPIGGLAIGHGCRGCSALPRPKGSR